LFAILSDGFATLPTLLKAWKHPETETSIGYITAFLYVILGIVVIHSYSFTQLGFLVYLLISDFLMVVAVCRKNPWQHLRADFAG
jgi:hypothetical protein